MLKRLVKVIAILSLALLLFVACLPSLISIASVHRVILSGVNRFIPGKVYVKELSCGWMKGILLHDLELIDPHGRELAKIKKISIDTPLLSLFSFPNIMAKVEIDSPKIALKPEPESPEIVIRDLHCFVDMNPEGKSTLELDMALEGEGHVHLDAQAESLLDLEKAYKEALSESEDGKTNSRLDVNCKIDAFPTQVASAILGVFDPQKAQLLLPALGNKLDATLQHSLHDGSLSFSLAALSPRLELSTRLKAKKSEFEIEEPLQLSWQISPQVAPIKESTTLKVVMPKQKGSLDPNRTMPITLSFAVDDKPLILESGLALHLNGEVKSESLQKGLELQLAAFKEKEPFLNLQGAVSYAMNTQQDLEITSDATLTFSDLPEVRLHAEIEPLHTQQHFPIHSSELKGKLELTSGDAKIQNNFSIQRASELRAQLDGSMHDVPVKIIEAFAKKELVGLLGEKLSGSWNSDLENGHVSLTGDGFTLDSSMKWGQKLTADANLDWQVSPERFRSLQKYFGLAQSEKQKEFKLSKPVSLKVDISSLKIAPHSPLESLEFKSRLHVSEIIFAPKEGQTVSLAPINAEAKLIGKERKIDFELSSEKGETKHAATLSITGSASNLWDESGLHLDKARILLDSKIQNLPLTILHSFSAKPETAQNVVAVLGEKVDAQLKGELKDLHAGTFRGQIQSPRFKSEVDCRLENGTLLLTQPLTAEYSLTPEAGEVLLKDVNPLLVTAARSQSPIKLTIDSKDFSIPLKPFSMKEMHMPSIKIEPGILTCKNGGMLSLLVSLLKAKSSSANEVDLWFTPMYIEVKKGTVFCKRTDALLADAFPIATWGSIDLIKNSIDMTLGLSGAAISRAFDITSINPDSFVQIPIRGSTQSPKIDTVRATAKITALKMQENRSNTAALLGGLLEVATTVGEKEGPVPPPTTSPFPWKMS